MKLHNLAVGLLMTSMAVAGELGSMDEKPWIGIFSGMEGRNFDFALGGDGESEVYFKKSGKRLSLHSTMTVRYILQEQIGGKWVTRQMADDGFDTKNKPGMDEDVVTFTATYTGDTRVEIVHEFGSSEVEIGVKIVESTTKNPLRAGVYVGMPDFHRSVKESDPEVSERDLKKKIADLRVEVISLDGKKVKLRKLYEESVNLEKDPVFGKGAREVSVEAKVTGERDVTLKTKDEELGKLEFKQSRRIFHGFVTYWWPVPSKTAEEDCRLVIGIK